MTHKLRYSLIPTRSLESVAEAFTSGQEKHPQTSGGQIDYAQLTVDEYINKIWRHLLAIQSGDFTSKDNGVRHEAAIAADAMILQELRTAGPKEQTEWSGLPATCCSSNIIQCPACEGHFSEDLLETHNCLAITKSGKSGCGKSR